MESQIRKMHFMGGRNLVKRTSFPLHPLQMNLERKGALIFMQN